MTWLMASEAAEPSVLAVPLGDLIIAIVAFLIVFGGLGKLALPKIKAVLQEREDEIVGGLKRAETAQTEADKLRADYKSQLAKAREEAAQIRTAAQADRANIIEQARHEAQVAAREVAASAHSEIEAEKVRATAELRRDLGHLATDLAGRIIGESLEDDQRAAAVVDRFIAELETVAAGVGSR